MEMKGDQLISADRQTVWEALNNPEILKACIPGCETLEKISDTELSATVVTKIGPVKAKFSAMYGWKTSTRPKVIRLSEKARAALQALPKVALM